jgi:hypothetical protein
VHLIDHHIAQALEKLRPLGVMRQNALMQHVRIADHDIATGAHRFARITRRIAVKGKGTHPERTGLIQRRQLRHLVLRQRLGGEHVQCLGLVTQGGLQYRQVVAQCFARCRRRHDHRMPACLHRFPGRRLVGVKPLDAAPGKRRSQPRIQPVRQRHVLPIPGRHHQLPGNARRILRAQARRQRLGWISRGWCQLLSRSAHALFSIRSPGVE